MLPTCGSSHTRWLSKKQRDRRWTWRKESSDPKRQGFGLETFKGRSRRALDGVPLSKVQKLSLIGWLQSIPTTWAHMSASLSISPSLHSFPGVFCVWDHSGTCKNETQVLLWFKKWGLIGCHFKIAVGLALCAEIGVPVNSTVNKKNGACSFPCLLIISAAWQVEKGKVLTPILFSHFKSPLL